MYVGLLCIFFHWLNLAQGVRDPDVERRYGHNVAKRRRLSHTLPALCS